MPGKQKTSGKKNKSDGEQNKQMENQPSKRQQMQEEHEKRWINCWNKRLEEEEQEEDCKACLAPDKFFPKPRKQSNVWYQMSYEKNTQNFYMAFKNGPVPKPKAPPAPKLRIVEDEAKNDAKDSKKSKKQGKKKKK
ncbi:hypothetical protein QAD02_009665 [Eretmocerus hayati]|uniref:Uncharacterized protein n=1 Tax=Eretmocerus hayati TaxID=131215 RepID=A0ACC2NAB8_9HYME|nr:hypothetical protein QAD02_009665 [Eretmocerus hayati]